MTSTGPASLRVSRRTQRTATFGACLLLGVAAWLTPATAARSALGATMRARSLQLADAKGTAALFAGDAVSAVLLFTPDHVPSNEALDAAERCRTALGEAPVRWLALVSDRYTRADLQQTLARPGRMLNVAFDGGDEVYAELAVPTVAALVTAGAQSVLLAGRPGELEAPLRDAGLKIELHDDNFPQNALDQVWLTEVGRLRWYVLTRDERIRYRRLEADAVRNARVGMFVVVSKNLTGPHTAQIIVNALGRIQRFISSHRRPFIAKIYRDGHVEKLDLSS